YVCRYDDYDVDYEEGFSPVVSEMNGHRNGDVRSHGPHHGRSGAHNNVAQEAKAAQPSQSDHELGACIFKIALVWRWRGKTLNHPQETASGPLAVFLCPCPYLRSLKCTGQAQAMTGRGD